MSLIMQNLLFIHKRRLQLRSIMFTVIYFLVFLIDSIDERVDKIARVLDAIAKRKTWRGRRWERGELKIKSRLIWNSPQVQCSPEFHKTCLCIHRESFLPYTFQNQPAWCGHLCLVARYPILNPCRNIQTDLFWKVEKPMKSSLSSVLWTTRLKTKY